MLRRLGALLALLVMLVLPPVALVVIGFRSWGSIDLLRPFDVSLVLATLTAVGWLAWAVWVVSVGVEAVALLRHPPRLPRLRALSGPRAVASALLGLVLASAVSGGAEAHPVSHASVKTQDATASTGAGVASPKARGATSTSATSEVSASARTLKATSAAAVADVESAPRAAEAYAATGRQHVVRAGDDLWSIAETYYGAGDAWRRLASANSEALADPLADLQPGMRLLVPEADSVTVVRGDTLSELAESHLGDARRWPEIHSLNTDVVEDPDVIDVGWQLRLPALPVGMSAAEEPAGGDQDRVGARASGAAAAPARHDGDQPASGGAAAAPARLDGDQPASGSGATQSGDGGVTADAPAPAPRPTEASAGPGAQPHSSGEPAGTAEGSVGPGAHPESSAEPSGGPEASAEPNAGAEASPAEGYGEHLPPPLAPDVAADAADVMQVVALVGGLTSLTATAVLGGLGVRRRLQERARPLGRRYAQPDEELTRYATALARLGAEPVEPALDRPRLVARAMRLLAHHWWSADEPAPAVSTVTLSDEALTFTFTDGLPSLPDPFTSEGASGTAEWMALEVMEEPDHCVAYPGLVTLGEDASGHLTMVDAVSSGVLGICGDGDALASEALSAMLVELACAPWAEDLQLTVVSDDARFVQGAGGDRVARLADAEAGVAEVERVVRERSRFIASLQAWNASRLDPDLAEAWGPRVVLFEVPLSVRQRERVRKAVEGTPCGVAAILPVEPGAGAATWTLTRTDGPRGVLTGSAATLAPQTVPAATREAISALYGLAENRDDEEAPWWGHGTTEDDVNIIALRPAASTTPGAPSAPSAIGTPTALAAPAAPMTPEDPTIAVEEAFAQVGSLGPLAPVGSVGPLASVGSVGPLVPSATEAEPRAVGPRLELLGPIRLVGALGSEPTRAARQCLEYCAWLLEHPGATAVQMGRSLLVAEGTRRSNMSRLRLWLGSDAEGALFLPDAYSGRISLHAGVTSDWQDLRDIVAGGIGRSTTERLTLALELVRGAPLADAAPGQWHWAEELRSDMAATVRDIAVVLATRLREAGDLDAARWAVNRGLVANPEDELLLAERIRVESAAGHLDEVHRLVTRLNRQARVLGVDLLPETVDLCQEVLEGRLRARHA